MDDCGSAAGIRLAGLFSIGKILTLYEINIVLCSRILMQGNSIRRSVCNLRDTKTVGRFSVLPGLGNRYETSQNSLLPFLFRRRDDLLTGKIVDHNGEKGQKENGLYWRLCMYNLRVLCKN